MARITQECIAQIKDAADIVDVIGRYLQLRRSGTSWKACCPFHSEKTPSFHVNPARQTFHCFGCHEGGDAIKFLMRFENLDYPTALRRLADMMGVTVIEEEENPEMARRRRLRAKVIAANQLAADYFHKQLCRSQEAAHAREYLKSRNININIAKSWQLGWAPPSAGQFLALARSQQMDDRLLKEAYLLGTNSRGSYPIFRDRLMFPIHNVRGEVVGFSGRIMAKDQDPRKYVNTADTAAFHKSELLFGLFKATAAIGRADMTVVVCEGQLDVIACHEKADIRNAVAGLGTAFTDSHAQMLKKYAKRAILCYDGDNAGIKASEKTYRKLAQAGLEVLQAVLPPGEDPDSLIGSQGPEALKAAIDSARPYLEVRVSHELEVARGDYAARATLVPRMAELAAEIPDSVRRDIAITDLSSRMNTGLEDLRATVQDIIRNRREAPRQTYQEDEPYANDGYDEYGEEAMSANDQPMAPVVPLRLHPVIRDLIQLTGNHPVTQRLLVERVEELQEAINELAGGIVLQRVLEKLPTPGASEEWEAFIATLPPEQAAAIRTVDITPIEMNHPEIYVDQACESAAKLTARTRIDKLKARIHGGNVPMEESMQLMQEINDLQRLLL